MKAIHGIVLIVALVILVPLTLIAVVVMQSSGIDLRMAGASASVQQAEHQVEGIIENALQQNGLSTRISTMGVSAALSVYGNNISTTVNMTRRAETVCKRKFNASSQNVIPSCRYIEMQAGVNYGKNARPLNWIAGVEQPLLKSE
ncbi:MAG: pilus assembly PilX family protein [Aeromonas popoffii]|jgi:type IV pilus assembly protein PilX|uniref:pilus assembly PilX family protein n=1 Tax=Aeromonas popoffii TaxID=70856 RepID=UPI003F3AB570